jgi:Holliday junction resolvase RusA-like endonuclease
MTQRDKWAKRPCVRRYHAFKDMIRMYKMQLPDAGASILFVIEMPGSWPEKKRASLDGRPHQQKPDVKNLLAALEDAIRLDDERIWNYAEISKVWGRRPRIEIEW